MMRGLILGVFWILAGSVSAAVEVIKDFDPVMLQRPDLDLTYHNMPEAIAAGSQQSALRAVTIGDFNTDGRQDILGITAGGQVVLLKGNPTHPNYNTRIDHWQAFAAPETVDLRLTSGGLLGLESGDFNADGLLDWAAAYAQGHVNFYQGDGTGAFVWLRRLHFDGELVAIHSGDYGRRDNLTDIALISTNAGAHLLHLLTSRNGAAAAPIKTQMLTHPATNIVAGRFDDDIHYDLAIAGGTSLSIYAVPDSLPARVIQQVNLPMTAKGLNFAKRGQLLVAGSDTGFWDINTIGHTRHNDNSSNTPIMTSGQSYYFRIDGDALKDRLLLDQAGGISIAFARSALFATFGVDSTGDSGDALPGDGSCSATGGGCTLRAAIEESNASAGMDMITVTVAGTTVPLTPYTITDPVIIDGTGGSTVIEQGSTEGPGVGIKPVFAISAGGTTIRGLTVMGPDGDSFARLTSGDGNLFTGNVFAITDSTNFGGFEIETADNIIGGTTVSERNIFAGVIFDIDGGTIDTATGNRVIGNYFGVDAGGASRLGTGSCVAVRDRDNEIGGSVAGSGNVITGFDGMSLLCIPLRVERFGESLGTLVQGNMIGTNAAGTAAIGNPTQGILVSDARDVTIGGSTPAAGNLISGNGNAILNGNEHGIHVTAATSRGDGLVIQGNYIGTDITGSTAIGNTGHGVFIDDVDGSLIGGSSAGAGNLISGNGEDGIHLEGFSGFSLAAPRIQGNRIGINLAADSALGNTGDGLHLLFVDDAQIGGTTAAAGNLIGANTGNGIILESPGSRRNIIEGNHIGTATDGQTDLGNGEHGIRVFSAQMGRIGGVANGAGNRIAFNALAGIAVQGLGSFGRENQITRNRIHDNVGLGIDLVGNGVVDVNDPGDTDAGPNLGQNFPEITALTGGDMLTGSLNSAASSTFTIEFFSSTSCDASGNGEGGVFVESISVTTNAAGDAGITHTLSAPIPEGLQLTATATDADGNTSEFSECISVVDSEVFLIDGFE